MSFEVNDNQQFVAKENGPIELDKRVTPKEREELERALSGEKDIIHADTNGNFTRLLHEDILPNISQFNLEVQEDLLALVEIHPETTDTASLSPEIQEYFGLDSGESPEFSASIEQLSKLGLDLNQFLEGLQQHIDEKLSFLSPESKSKVCKSIGIKTLLLGEAIDDMDLQKLSGQDLLSQRWIVNSKIQDAYSFYTQELFPSLELHNAIGSGQEVPSEFTDEKETRSLENGTTYEANNQKYVDIDMHMGEIDELLDASIDDEGNFDEGFFSTQKLLLISNDKHEALFEEMGIETSDNISLLNEEDKTAESIASIGDICLLGIACLPVIGAVGGAAMDINEISGNQSLAVQGLKESGLIPSGYQREVTAFGRIAASFGLAATVLLTPTGLQGIVRTGKLVREMSKIRHVDTATIEKVISLITQKMGIGENAQGMLKGLMGVGETVEPANLNRAPNIQQDIQRTNRHSTLEGFESIGGRSNEYGFVDESGQLHINTTLLNSLPEADKGRIMREFIAHERAHQAIMNLPQGELQKIHESFMINNIFGVVAQAEKYGLHFRDNMTPLDTTNEILAHMIGRMRVGSEVPDNFVEALSDVGYYDILGSFGINASRTDFINNGGVRNSENLVAAAMTSDNFNYGNLSNILSKTDVAEKSAEDIFKLIGEHLPENFDLLELEVALGIGNQKLIELVQSKLGNKIDEFAIMRDDLLALLKNPLDMTGGELFNFLETATGIDKRLIRPNCLSIKNIFTESSGNIVNSILNSDNVLKSYKNLGEEDFMKILDALSGNTINQGDREKILSGFRTQSQQEETLDAAETIVTTSTTAAEVAPKARFTESQVLIEQIPIISLDEVLDGLSSIGTADAISLLEKSDLQVAASELRQLLDNDASKWFQEGNTIYIIMNGKVMEIDSRALSAKIGGDMDTYFRENGISSLSSADRGHLRGDLLSQAINRQA